MKKIIFFIFILFISCSKKTEEAKTNSTQISFDNIKVSCLRWFERDIYFATSDPIVTNRNNQFHKDYIKAALKKLEYNTKLGEDYFRIKEVNADILDPLMPSTLNKDEYKSFILIWEDSKFESFVNTNIAGGMTALPDKNAITVTNAKYQRKFYMIFRASCFESSNKCAGSDNSGIGLNGINALVMRQFGLISRISPINCNTSSLNRLNIMCADPGDVQWNTDSQSQFYATFSNQLTSIVNNINFYQDSETAAGCLPKQFMDREIYPACPESNRNNSFRILDVYNTLDEIGCSTILGCNYFKPNEDSCNAYTSETSCNAILGCNFGTDNLCHAKTEYLRPQCVAESGINMTIDKQINVNETKSYLMIWTDDYFNNWINSNGYNLPDINGFVLQNAAEKSKYKFIFRDSCFDAFNPNCDAGNGGISEPGRRALVARQLAQMLGITTRDCTTYPDDVMCSDIPKDTQWSESSKNRFFNRFNNYLELIGNNPTFYSKQYSTSDSTN